LHSELDDLDTNIEMAVGLIIECSDHLRSKNIPTESCYTITVNRRPLLHIVLIAAVWLSQLASTLHLVGHLDDPVHAHGSASIECIQEEFHTHAHIDHALTSEDSGCSHSLAEHTHQAPSTADIVQECSLYHVYLGMYACITAPLPQTNVALQAEDILLLTAEQVINLPANRQRIRAPPLVS